jgi:hypothetical protein
VIGFYSILLFSLADNGVDPENLGTSKSRTFISSRLTNEIK